MTRPDGADGADEPTLDEVTPTDDDHTAPLRLGAPAPGDAPGDLDGPRRRARRERAERRAAQERAVAIETARREAKRRIGAAAGAGHGDATGAGRSGAGGLKVVGGVALAAVAAVVLGLVLWFTPLMSARTIAVVGTGVVTREEVVAAAGVAQGTPLLQIDTDAVADRVATIRRVAGARVQREYPSTLRVSIVERVAVAQKEFADGPHLFDRDGVDFAAAAPPPGLPYLDVATPGPSDPPTEAALEVLTSLRPEVAGTVSAVAAPSVSSITLTLTDGRVVVWGTTDRTAEKAETLAALLTQPGRTYDVSSPDLPTVT